MNILVIRERRIELSSFVFAISLTAWAATAAYLNRPFPGDQDDGQYLVSARSLSDLEGYRLPSRLGNPVATKYPMGASTIAAVVMRLLPGTPSTEHDWLAGKIVVLAAGVVLAVASRRLFILSGLSLWAACFLALSVVWHPAILHLTASLMSDVPYAAISTVLLARWVRRASQDEVSTTEWAVDGILAGVGCLIRGNGITLVAAAAAASLCRPYRYWATVAVSVGVACTWLPATIHMRTMLGPHDTNNYATEMVAAYRFAGPPWSLPLANTARIPGLLVAMVASPTVWTRPLSSVLSRWAALRWLTCITTLSLMTLGIRLLIVRNAWPRPVWIHSSLTLIVFVLWHYPIDNRFILPLAPLVLAACALGFEMAKVGRLGSIAFSAITMTVSLLVVGGIILPRAVPHGGVMGEGQNPSVVAMFEAIRANTPSNAVIVCGTPELVYLNTGRVCVQLRDDVAMFSRIPPSWEVLRRQLRSVGDRPVYLLDAPALETNIAGLTDNDIGSIKSLLKGGQVGPKPIAVGSDGYLWRVERSNEP